MEGLWIIEERAVECYIETQEKEAESVKSESLVEYGIKEDKAKSTFRG